MIYTIVKKGAEKSLADFHYGECFSAVDLSKRGVDISDTEALQALTESDSELHMVIGVSGVVATKVPNNLTAVLNMETGEAHICRSSDVFTPIVVKIITDDAEE